MPTVRNLFLRDLLLHRLGNGVPPETCSSVTGHLNSPAAVLMDRSAPPTTPSLAALTSMIRARSRTLTASPGATEMTTRPWVSPKSRASSRSAGKGGQINLRADQARRVAGDLPGDAAFRQGHGQAAFAAIVRAFDQAGENEPAQGVVQFALLFQIATRRRAGFQAVNAAANKRSRRGRGADRCCQPYRPAG